jgi:hypothetical protein
VADQWYYKRGEQTHGPVPVAELKTLAATGLLQPDDLLWPEGMDPAEAIAACAALDFSALARVAHPLPDWLSDVEQAQPSGPLPPPAMSPQLPDWLADVRMAETEPVPPPAPTESGPPATGEHAGPAALPDWVESLRQTEQVLVPPAPTIEPAPEIPTVLPAKEKLHRGDHQATTEDATIPEVLPADQEKEPPAETVPLAERFRKARIEIEHWVDRDENRLLVLSGDLEAVRRDADLQEVLRRYEGFGDEMTAKLWRHLEFMVENRRKYYSTRA